MRRVKYEFMAVVVRSVASALEDVDDVAWDAWNWDFCSDEDVSSNHILCLWISHNLISKLFWDSELKFGESIYLPSVSVHQSGRYSRRIVLCQFRVPEKQFLNLISNYVEMENYGSKSVIYNHGVTW